MFLKTSEISAEAQSCFYLAPLQFVEQEKRGQVFLTCFKKMRF